MSMNVKIINVDINDFTIFFMSKFKTSRKVFCGPETSCCNAVDGLATTGNRTYRREMNESEITTCLDQIGYFVACLHSSESYGTYDGAASRIGGYSRCAGRSAYESQQNNCWLVSTH